MAWIETVVKVAVDNAAFQFDRLYSYRVPVDLLPYAVTGARVLVPFGRSAPRMGVVMDTAPAVDDDADLKSVIDIERGEPLLGDEMVRIIRLLRDTTFCTYYDGLRAVLPKNSRLVAGDGTALAPASRGHLETVYRYLPADPPPRLTPKQQVVCGLLEKEALSAPQAAAAAGVTRAVIDRLAEKGILTKIEREKDAPVYAFAGETQVLPEMTPPQREAFEKITARMDAPEGARTTLLHGVTSSGKTILYIKLIEKTVKENKGALVLVPEIALAGQMIYRLRALFGGRVAILHSALSDTERQIQWSAIRRGACDIVVGTRSAVFAPLARIGLIIIDEEQEQAYHSEQSPRYSAGIIAAFRARYHNAQLLLSSATPSVESYYRAKTGAYHLVTLNERYGRMPLPAVRVVDMRRELLAGNSHYISSYLKGEIDARIARGEQCILLLNRRGYRTVSMCNACRTIVKCKACDTPLVVHKPNNAYVCHYCGRSYEIMDSCAECGGSIRHTGIGTQKIEEDLEALFPDARILRLDLDAVSRKFSVDQLLAEFTRGEYDMIIGTQMIAKGLDFPNVTLVGVLSIDQLLLMPSFRANERTFSMLTQVVGRSGRGEKRGEAVIQTIDPDNAIIRLAADQNYEGFYRNEIVARKVHLYPPYCAMCAVGFIAEKEAGARESAQAFAEIMIALRAEEYGEMPLRVLGPAPMRVAYINDLYRYQILLKHRADREFRSFLRRCVERYHAGPGKDRARLYVDFSGDGE